MSKQLRLIICAVAVGLPAHSSIGEPPASSAVLPCDAPPAPPSFIHPIVAIRATARGTELVVGSGQRHGISKTDVATLVDDEGQDVKNAKLEIVNLSETTTVLLSKLSPSGVHRYTRVRLKPRDE